MKTLRRTAMVVVFVTMAVGNAFAYTNDQVADVALEHNGFVGYTCKQFVQHVIEDHLSGNLDAGYKSCYLEEGYEILDESEVVKGDIIQVSNDTKPSDTAHVHSAIVLENLGNGNFKVVHSNWCNPPTCNTVSVHPSWNPSRWAKYGSSDTLDYPDWSAHFYRLGDTTPSPLHSYTFPNNTSEGWAEGYDTAEQDSEENETWRVRVIGPNPGVLSPTYVSGELPKDSVVYFSVKQRADGCDTFYPGKIWVKDETGSWNNSVTLGLANAEYDYNGGNFKEQDYNVWKADLSTLREGLQVRQFSIELNDDWCSNQYWTFHWIKIYNKASVSIAVSSGSIFLAASSEEVLPDPEPITEEPEPEPTPTPNPTATTYPSGYCSLPKPLKAYFVETTPFSATIAWDPDPSVEADGWKIHKWWYAGEGQTDRRDAWFYATETVFTDENVEMGLVYNYTIHTEKDGCMSYEAVTTKNDIPYAPAVSAPEEESVKRDIQMVDHTTYHDASGQIFLVAAGLYVDIRQPFVRVYEFYTLKFVREILFFGPKHVPTSVVAGLPPAGAEHPTIPFIGVTATSEELQRGVREYRNSITGEKEKLFGQ